MINQEGIQKDAFLIWPAGRDSNPRSPESESGALSGYATGGNICNYYITKNYFFNTKDELYNRFMSPPVRNPGNKKENASESFLKKVFYL